MPERLRKERDFYLRVLELGDSTDLASLLAQALELVVEASDAARAYLEIRDELGEPHWTIAHGFDEHQQAQIRAAISQGIIAQAVATGRTVQTTSAVRDPRFSARASVQRNQIEGVLCAPFHRGPLTGAVYLESEAGRVRFAEDDIRLVETLARHLAPVANRLVARRRKADDPTQVWRARLQLDGLVGRSPALAAIMAEIAGAAPIDVNVLLTGPSGSGKSAVARLIHANSLRRSGPFVELNCATLDTLVESELFGTMPGAYTDAVKRPGKVEAARGGTLFLDEIGELTPAAQAKLLQLLDGKTYFKVGGDDPQTADVRLIAATNVDLAEAVATRRFRQDLYYRIRVIAFELPSLAARVEDIEDLAAHFATEIGRRNGMQVGGLTPAALEALQLAEWPGNVRQLANVMEAAMARARHNGHRFLEVSDLFPDRQTDPSDPADTSLQAATRRFQRTYLQTVLGECGWNVSEAARKLGLARSHVYTLLKEHGLRRE